MKYFSENMVRKMAPLLVMLVISGMKVEASQESPALDVQSSAAAVLKVSGERLDKLIEDSTVPVLIEFWASWAKPALRMDGVVERIANQYAGKLLVVRVDISEPSNKALIERFQVVAVPTLVLTKRRGNAATRFGYKNDDSVIISWVDEQLQK